MQACLKQMLWSGQAMTDKEIQPTQIEEKFPRIRAAELGAFPHLSVHSLAFGTYVAYPQQ